MTPPEPESTESRNGDSATDNASTTETPSQPEPIEIFELLVLLDPRRTKPLRDLDNDKQANKTDSYYDLWNQVLAAQELNDIGLPEFRGLPASTQTRLIELFLARAQWPEYITPALLIAHLKTFPAFGDVYADTWYLDAPPIDWTQHPAPVQAETPTPPVVSTRWREGARVLMEALGRMDCPPSRILVALALLSFANKEGKAWPSYATLANLTNLARSTVQDSIRWLLDHQVIEVIEPPEPHASARYRLIPLEGQER